MEDNERGLYTKYQILKADGTPVNPDNAYFVLRFNGSDAHAKASRLALLKYADEIREANPQLASDLVHAVMKAAAEA